jgi:4-aminobutyrate aminotransferase
MKNRTFSPHELDSLRSEGDINLSTRRAEWLSEHIDSETQRVLEEDARYFLHQSLSTPCLNVLKGCDGAYIEDLQGRRILDFHGNWVHQVGFRNERVVEAIVQQMQDLPFCTRRYTNKPAVELAKRLVGLAPGDLNKVLFAPAGALAMSMALKLARAATGRHKTISMWDAFHGASLDTISIGGEAIFRKDAGPLMPGTEHVPPPNPSECPWHCGKTCSLHCADYIDYVLEKEGDVAAVIAETVRSTPYIPPPEYWKRVRAACDRHGALLILDEIPHALGRTGKMFTVEHYDIVPDMLVIGKGLGGGIFPLAALIAREGLDVVGEKALGHFTHEKNPVACAAALATIDFIEAENLLAHVVELGAYAIDRLNTMRMTYPIIGDVRGIGLMMGVEIDHENASDVAESIMYSALARGLSFKLTMGNILLLVPALTLTREEMDAALEILTACFEEIV